MAGCQYRTCLNGHCASGLLVEAQQAAHPVAQTEGKGVQYRHRQRQLRAHSPACVVMIRSASPDVHSSPCLGLHQCAAGRGTAEVGLLDS